MVTHRLGARTAAKVSFSHELDLRSESAWSPLQYIVVPAQAVAIQTRAIAKMVSLTFFLSVLLGGSAAAGSAVQLETRAEGDLCSAAYFRGMEEWIRSHEPTRVPNIS